MLSGLTGLLWESGRRAYGEAWPFRWAAIKEFAPYFCAKPADTPVKKDNAYGYGLPAVSVLVGQIAPAKTPIEETMDMFPIALMMGMMGQMMGGIL